MVKVTLNDHLALFHFQTTRIPKIKQEYIKLKIFLNFTVAEIARRFRKKSGHTQIFSRALSCVRWVFYAGKFAKVKATLLIG